MQHLYAIKSAIEVIITPYMFCISKTEIPFSFLTYVNFEHSASDIWRLLLNCQQILRWSLPIRANFICSSWFLTSFWISSMVSFIVNFLNDFNLFSTEFMHSFAFWLYSSGGFPSQQRDFYVKSAEKMICFVKACAYCFKQIFFSICAKCS